MAEARIFYEKDCDLNYLKGKTVAIIGVRFCPICGDLL